MIQVEGLTKVYGQFKAIDRLSFHADVGEIVGFVGRNGAGKTTTIRILTGYMPPNEGTAKVAGYDILEESIEVRRRVGYLPETVPLINEMTVWGYVEYMARLQGLRGREVDERVETVLDMVDMLDRENSMIANISRGMRQRVGLAQSIVHNPDVLIMDEPASGLDPDQRAELRESIRNMSHDRTVFLSSHDLAELERLATRVLIIDKGKIIAEDKPGVLASRLEADQSFMINVRDVPFDKLHAILSEIEGVTAVTEGEKGVLVSSSRDTDTRPLVASAIVGQSWDLLELRSVDYSLEDIFLQLTNEGEDNVADNENDDDELED